MQRPYAYDNEYLLGRIALGHEVTVDGKQYTKAGDVPSQAELDKLLDRDGFKSKDLKPVDPLVPHGDPATPPISETAGKTTVTETPKAPTAPEPVVQKGRKT